MAAQINANELLSVIARSEGVTAGELAFMWDVNLGAMQAAIDKLCADKRIVSSVQKESSENIVTWLVCWLTATGHTLICLMRSPLAKSSALLALTVS